MNHVRLEAFIESRVINCALPDKLRKVFQWSRPSYDLVRQTRKGGLVSDCVVNLRLNARLLAPKLRKDVMDIDTFIPEHCVVDILPRTKVPRAGLASEAHELPCKLQTVAYA